MKISALNNIQQVKHNNSSFQKSFKMNNDSFEPSFKGVLSDPDRKFWDSIIEKYIEFRKDQHEKSLPQNLTDKQINSAVRAHGEEYLESLKTREEKEYFLTLMARTFDGEPLSGYSQTLSAYEANLIIVKGIEDVQQYIDLVTPDKNYESKLGLSRVLGRYEAGELMEAGVEDYQAYIDLVDKDKQHKPISGYSRVLTTKEAVQVLSEGIKDIQAFIDEQDVKNK